VAFDDQSGQATLTDLLIRNASIADAPLIADFNSAMALETEDRVLDPNLINPGVAAVLADGNKGHYWIAEREGRPIGQIMVTHEWSDWRNGFMWWIQSVYVTQDARRAGVFLGLYRHVESLAKNDSLCCGIRLYVEQDNERAQNTYLAVGMVDPGYRVMETDFRKNTDAKQEQIYA